MITVETPVPHGDDLMRAAAWLEDQADEANAVAGALSGQRTLTTEADRTRETAAWLRRQAREGTDSD